MRDGPTYARNFPGRRNACIWGIAKTGPEKPLFRELKTSKKKKTALCSRNRGKVRKLGETLIV